MKRSGGRIGRPFGHVTIEQLENHVRASQDDPSELTAVLAELGHRQSKRAEQLKSLVQRLLGEKSRPPQRPHDPILE